MNTAGFTGPWPLAMFLTCRSELETRTGRGVEMMMEHPGGEVFISNPKALDAYNYLFRSRYEGKIDYIVAWGPATGLPQIATQLPGVPVVLSSILYPAEKPHPPLPDNVYHDPLYLGVTGTVQAALHVLPDTRSIIVITGTGAFGSRYERFTRMELGNEYQGRTLEYWAGVPLPELEARVGALPEYTIIVYLAQAMDKAGNSYVPQAVLQHLSPLASVPIFGVADTYIGKGILGGYVFSSAVAGRRAADIIARLEAGQEVKTTGPVDTLDVLEFDWEQMQRWGVSEDQLPAHAEMMNRPASFFVRNPAVLPGLFFSVAFIVLGLLVYVWYLYQREDLLKKIILHEQREIKLHEKYSAVINITSDAIITVDLDGNITLFSTGAERMFGYATEEMIGSHISRLYPADMRAQQQKLLEDTLSSGSLQGVESLRQTADGRIIPVEITLNALKDDQGNPSGLVGTIRDITNRKEAEKQQARLEEQLHQSQKMESIGRLAGGVAHDFNNLLTAIQGFSDILHESLPPGSPLTEYVEEIQRAGDSAAGLTGQLLAFSRKQIVAPERLNLNTIVAQSEKMLRRIIGEDIELIVKPEEGIADVLLDPGQIEHVLINLAVNSRDAMPRGGTLTLATSMTSATGKDCETCHNPMDGDYVLLSVSDTGEGIDPETQQNIFEPFFTTKEKGKGTGLGLSTIHGIVHQNKGHIHVWSEPGQGTTFNMHWPAAPPQHDEAEKISSKKPPPKTARGTETVLVVEDQEVVLKLAAGILRSHGYTVVTAKDGLEAITKFREEQLRIDILLTDVVMPRMGGKELYEHLQTPYPHLKAVFMSGYTDSAIVQQGILDKDIEYIQKPFKPAELARKIRQVLDAGPGQPR